VRRRLLWYLAGAAALASIPIAVLAQGSADPAAALGGAGAGSLVGSFIGAAIGSWRAVRKGWDEETALKARNILAEELLRHQLTCPLRTSTVPTSMQLPPVHP
jgi:hypothetical protein